jgi:hypothetical protein
MTSSGSMTTGERMRSRVTGRAPSRPRSRSTLVVLGVLALVALAPPAGAEHMTVVDPSPEAAEHPREGSHLDVRIKIGVDQFRLSGRLFGPDGGAGVWLFGERGPNGYLLDGRVQTDRGRAYDFKLDAGVVDGLGRSLRGWLSRGPDAIE